MITCRLASDIELIYNFDLFLRTSIYAVFINLWEIIKIKMYLLFKIRINKEIKYV